MITVDCHRGRRGPYTGVGSVLRRIVSELDPQLLSHHAIEIAAVAPELAHLVGTLPQTLTATAPPKERTRWHSRLRTRRIAHGIVDLLRHQPHRLRFTGVDHADFTDLEFLEIAKRRGLCVEEVGPSTDDLLETGDPSFHDRRADELEATGEFSYRLGAVPFHRVRGSDPDAARKVLREAVGYCLNEAFYDAGLALVDQLKNPEDHYFAQTQRADFLFLLGRATEVEPIYYDLLARSIAPLRHMSISYAIAMLYTRIHAERDHHRARAHVNTAIAIAEALGDPFHIVFMHNGKALVEMHLGNLEESLRLVTEGIAMLDERLPAQEHRLHRSVLRHNRGQVLAALGHSDEALIEFDHVVEVDPNYPEYRFDRGNLLNRMGRHVAALADYEVAMRLGPPFPELYHNRGDLRATMGNIAEAVADFRYTLDLEPDFDQARMALAALLPADEAITLLQEAPTPSAELHCARGLSLLDLPDLDAAQEAFDEALKLDPELIPAWVNRAIVHFERAAYQKAVADLDRAHELEPGNPDVLHNRGFAQEAAGRFAEAAQDYRLSLARDRGDSQAAFDGLARCESALGIGEDLCK